MLSLAERVNRTIYRDSLLPPGARVVVALSGGADSTALACLLVELARGDRFRVVGAAHFNHRLREAADQDEAFCRALAERLGLQWRSGAEDVRAAASDLGMSLEEGSRHLRYAFLLRAARELGATHVAVGHTRDDQAETVLLQLFRGAGPGGLRGMTALRRLDASSPEEKGPILLVRPLLEVGHRELVAWLVARSMAFREDESNRDPRFLRNRVRHEVIPFLEHRVGGSISRVLARDASIAASDAAYLNDLAWTVFRRLATVGAGRVELQRDALVKEPDAIARRVVLLALGNLSGRRFVGFDQAERVLRLARGDLAGPLALPGAQARVASEAVVLLASAGRDRRATVPANGAGMNLSGCALSIPGEAALPGSGWVVSSSLREWKSLPDSLKAAGLLTGVAEAVVDAALAVGLAVRRRRPGDWFRPLGLGGRKKLQDYFVDRKVPRDERDRVPLVVDRRDRIVWVAGHGIDEEFRVNAGTRDVVILKLRGESA